MKQNLNIQNKKNQINSNVNISNLKNFKRKNNKFNIEYKYKMWRI